mgnify:CR=1 FL=1
MVRLSRGIGEWVTDGGGMRGEAGWNLCLRFARLKFGWGKEYGFPELRQAGGTTCFFVYGGKI